jgi:hypothetical protein
VTPPTWLAATGRPPHVGVLDLWPRGRADALPGSRPAPVRLGAAPDLRSVWVRAGESSYLGPRLDAEPGAVLRAHRPVLARDP